MVRGARLGGFILALACACLVAAPAHAEGSGDPAAARALFAEGRKLVQTGHAAEACPKFEESLRLDFGIGTQFNLADCWERTGRTASAWALFLDVAAAARAAGQGEREEVARDRAKALEPKLSRLVVRVERPAPGLEVQRDGVVLGPATYGTPVPVDPGEHQLTAHADGYATFSRYVEIPARPETVTVTLPELQAAVPDGAASDMSKAAAARSDTVKLGAEQAPSSGGNGPLLVSGIVTGALAAGFGVTALLYSGAHSDFEAANVADDATRFDKRDRAKTLGIVNFALLGATVVGAGVTIYFWASGSHREQAASRVSLQGVAAPSFQGVVLSGAL
jgi:hypothetical protein